MALTPADIPGISATPSASAARPKRRWIVALFALPFAAGGLSMLVFMLVPTLLDAYRGQGEVQWGLVAIYLVATLIFGGFGLWLLWRSLWPRAESIRSTSIEDKPWLARPEWLGPEIGSGARTGMWGAWGIAAIWNLVSIPLAVMMVQASFEGQRAALAGLLFPLLGLLLVGWAVKQTASWRRFGKTSLSMDPYPGAVGGQVGGTLDIRLPYDPAFLFRASLCCAYSYMSGSGKNRSRRERVVWQSEGLAHTSPWLEGTRLEILFDVDDGLPPSDFQDQSSYHLWRLHLEADLPGVDFDRSFEIPVFPTSELASELRRLSTEHRQAGEQRRKAIDQVLDVQHIPGGVELYYPAFRNPQPKLIGLTVGVVFLGVAVLTGGQDVPVLLRLIFGGVGGLATAGCLWFLLLSTRVRLDHARLETRKRLLGIPAGGTSVPRNEIKALSLKRSFSSSAGKKHTIWFKLLALTDAGRAITVGYNLAGQETARQALETISGLTGIPVSGTEEGNVLA